MFELIISADPALALALALPDRGKAVNRKTLVFLLFLFYLFIYLSVALAQTNGNLGGSARHSTDVTVSVVSVAA